eukprot:3786928-Pyramimonas_sp.AAC.1
MKLEGVCVVFADQCRFGLKGQSDKYWKKPTAFVTNSPYIAAEQGRSRARDPHQRKSPLRRA